MITFDHIDDYSRKYDFFNRYLRFAHNYIYYKNFYIIGKENIPPKGEPIMVISNHQNGLMDALAILYLFDDYRQPVFIARGDIFKKDKVAKILRFLKIMPTFRSRDGSRSDIKKNNETFDIAAHVLQRGGTICLFPEAGHQAGCFLSTFKKGFPRIAFSAEEISDYQLNLKILPLNIHYSNYFSARNELMVTVGKPFDFKELFELYKIEPNNAFIALNEKSRNAIQQLSLDISCPEYYEELNLLRLMTCKAKLKSKGLDYHYFPHHLKEDKETIASLLEMKEKQETQFVDLMTITRKYKEGLKLTNLRDWVIGYKVSVGRLMAKSLWLLLLFPFFLFGLVNNCIPFNFSAIFRKKIKDRMLHSSFNYVSSLIIAFPIFYLILFILVWCISGSFVIGFGYLAATFFTLFVFYSFKKMWIKYKALVRYSRLVRKKDSLIMELITIKERIFSLLDVKKSDQLLD